MPQGSSNVGHVLILRGVVLHESTALVHRQGKASVKGLVLGCSVFECYPNTARNNSGACHLSKLNGAGAQGGIEQLFPTVCVWQM